MSETALKMNEIANSHNLRVPTRGFWGTLCDMVGKVGLPPYMRNGNSIDKFQPVKFPLKPTFASSITKTIVGSHVQLNSYVPDEIMRDVPIAVPWKLLERVYMPSMGQSMTTGPTTKAEQTVTDRQGRSLTGLDMVAAVANGREGSAPLSTILTSLDQNNNVEPGELMDIPLFALRSPSQADIIYGSGTMNQISGKYLKKISPYPIRDVQAHVSTFDFPQSVRTIIKRRFADATAQVMAPTHTTATPPNISDAMTQLSHPTVAISTQTSVNDTMDATTQISSPSTVDSTTEISETISIDVKTQTRKPGNANAIIQTSQPVTADISTQIIGPKTLDFTTPTNEPIARDAMIQANTVSLSVSIQCSPRDFSALFVEASTSTSSMERMCHPETADRMTQTDPTLTISPEKNECLEWPVEAMDANLITDFVVDLVDKYISAPKTDFNNARRENEIRAEVGQFLSKMRGECNPGVKLTADSVNVPERSLPVSEEEKSHMVPTCDVPTQETTESEDSDVRGFVDLRMSRSEPILVGQMNESSADFSEFLQYTTRSLPANEFDYLTSLDAYLHPVGGFDMAPAHFQTYQYSLRDNNLEASGHEDGHILCASKSEPHLKCSHPFEVYAPKCSSLPATEQIDDRRLDNAKRGFNRLENSRKYKDYPERQRLVRSLGSTAFNDLDRPDVPVTAQHTMPSSIEEGAETNVKSDQAIVTSRKSLGKSGRGDYPSWKLPDVFVPIVEMECIEWVLKDDGVSHWVLGKGCYGSVLWAKYRREGGFTTNVAIKVMKDPSCADTTVREAKILMHLQDTGVFPEFYGYVNISTGDELNVCLVQKMFGDGRTIAHLLIDNDTQLDQSEWMSVCIQLAEGLKKIHEKEVVLNDLKENNVLINDSVVGKPVIKFIDVGVSTYTHGVSYKLTDDELKCLIHIAPEIKNNMASSYLSDIYSLGTIYKAISKKVDIIGLADLAKACTSEIPEERLSVDTIIECLSTMRQALGLT